MDEKLIYFYEKIIISLFNFLDTVGVSIFMTISFNVKSIKDVEYVVWIFEYSELILLFYAWNRHRNWNEK